jgi:hypothetical protein
MMPFRVTALNKFYYKSQSFKSLKKDLEENGKNSSKIIEKTFTFLIQNLIVSLFTKVS